MNHSLSLINYCGPDMHMRGNVKMFYCRSLFVNFVIVSNRHLDPCSALSPQRLHRKPCRLDPPPSPPVTLPEPLDPSPPTVFLVTFGVVKRSLGISEHPVFPRHFSLRVSSSTLFLNLKKVQTRFQKAPRLR